MNGIQEGCSPLSLDYFGGESNSLSFDTYLKFDKGAYRELHIYLIEKDFHKIHC